MNLRVHVRRTDKVKEEAKFHEFNEYLAHVKEFYDIEEAKVSNKMRSKRCIFVASDDRKLLSDLKSNNELTLNYELKLTSDWENNQFRSSRKSFDMIVKTILDVMKLANSDFLVCTFSSNLCRLAYELMQTRYHSDASWRFKSLDDAYYFHDLGGSTYVVSNSKLDFSIYYII